MGGACHTVYTIEYARKDHRSNNRDIGTKGLRLSKKCSEKGQRKKEN